MGRADVTVGGEIVGAIGRGLLALVGAERGDGAADVAYVARRIAAMRVFDAPDGAQVGVAEAGGEVLVVSQFTLLGEMRRGRRPDFGRAAGREEARPLVAAVVASLRAEGLRVAEGAFGADMQVGSVNDGPYTILLESRGGSQAPASPAANGETAPCVSRPVGRPRSTRLGGA